MTLHAVLFDLDGTLIDSAPLISTALNQVIAQRGGELVADETVRGLVSRGASELVSTAFGRCRSTPQRDLEDFRAIYSALPPDPAHLYPGAGQTLRLLADAGLKLGICTNKPQALTEALLAGLGLAPLFGAIVGGDSVPRQKPHGDHVHATLAKLEITAADAVFVGDSEMDAQAAHSAGIAFVLVNYGYANSSLEDIPHQARIDRLDQLPVLLRNMCPQG